jgi:hypothetical protein
MRHLEVEGRYAPVDVRVLQLARERVGESAGVS